MKFNRHTIPNAAKALWRLGLNMAFGHEPIIASEGVTLHRRSRCGACVHRVVDMLGAAQCSRCTCVISLKTMMATEECPVGWWKQQTRFSTGL